MNPKVLAIGCAMISAACGSADRGGSSAGVRDSAGVTIVENRGTGMWSGGQPWRLSPEPRVDIGAANGAPAYRLFRVYGAGRLRNGRIVVVNGGTNELRFYDPAGEFLFATGREGDGPGEFRDLQAVWQLASDSLLAYDFLAQRLSVLTLNGAYTRSFRVESPAGQQLLVRGLFRDGSLLVASAPRMVAAGTSSGMVRASAPYFRYSREGVLLDTVGSFPSQQVYRLVLGQDDYRLTSPPFARNARSTVSPLTLVEEDSGQDRKSVV